MTATFVNIDHVHDDANKGIGVECSFVTNTRSEGIVIGCISGDIVEYVSQPSLHLYPEKEQYYMKLMTKICYVLTFSGYRRNL